MTHRDITLPIRGAAAWRISIRHHLLAGAAAAAVLTVGLGGWAATTNLAGAIIAQGSVVVDSNVKKVQHPTGGTVGELRVRDGDHVKAGDILVRLDDTVTRANLAIVAKGLDELAARKARLESERDGTDQIAFADDLLARVDDPDLAHVMASESKLAALRRSARVGQKAQLRQRIEQFEEETRGDVAQQNSKTVELSLIERELAGVKELYQRNLVQLTRLTQLEREKSRLEGERGQLIAATAQVKGKIAETELQIIQIDQNLSSDVAKELREIEDKIGELVERKVAAEDQLKRVAIRAPQDGTVFQLAVHTLGGVITAGEPIMLIVPDADKLN
jgi:HlyD family secretion protein